MIPTPKNIDFTPWIISTEPDGDLGIRDDAPDDVKQAWQTIQDQIDGMYGDR